jgi:quinol monooxygenase YgiN
MSFMQIVSFHTDSLDRFEELNRRWLEESEGRRTVVDGALYRDRTDPTHYVSVNHFASWEDAQANSSLPETDAYATEAMSLATGPVEFTDLDLVSSADVRVTLAERLHAMLETNEVLDGLIADDVTVDMFVPQWQVVTRGVDQMMAGLREEAPGRTFEQWEAHPITDGVFVEYAYRTHPTPEQPATLSVGTLVARLRGGRVASLRVHCAGNWSAELEQQIAEANAPATAGVPA